jgi:quinoprotein relay system zinc metallohydrolase 2
MGSIAMAAMLNRKIRGRRPIGRTVNDAGSGGKCIGNFDLRCAMPSFPILVAIVILISATHVISAGADEPAPVADFEISEIAPGNFVHYGSFDERSADNLGDNANIGFIVGENCVMVVDTGGSLPVGRALRQAIRRVTPLPVCYVVLTHVHPDHFFGAAAFLEDQPQFIAHRNYPAQLAARSRSYLNSLRRDLGAAAVGSEIVRPSLLVDGQREFDLGGRVAVVQAWPAAHTDDDLTVFDMPTRTLWLSDLLFVGHTPVIDGTITGFLAVMKDLRGIEAGHYVPGHGRSDLVWPRALDAQQRYFTLILNETRAAIRNRKTIQQATDQVGLAEAGNWAAFELFHRRNVIAAYTELEWE